MKRFLSVLAIMFATVFMFSSCDKDSVGLLYNVKVEGTANGVVSYTVPTVEGTFTANGELSFKCSNDTTLVKGVLPLGAALEDDNNDVVLAAQMADAWVNSAFKFDGDYHVKVTGYVKVAGTGIVLEINEEFPPVS